MVYYNLKDNLRVEDELYIQRDCLMLQDFHLFSL